MRVSLFVVVLCAFFIAGCTPASWNLAQKSYNEGDIQSAVTFSVQTLRDKPNYAAAVQFLNDNLPKTYEDLLQKAKQAESAKNWEEAHSLYVKIKAISDAVAGIPPQTNPQTKTAAAFATKNVDAELEAAAQAAAEKNYQSGVGLESAGKSKDAAKAYTVAMKYVSGYKDAQERYDKCRTAAIKRVAVMSFDNTSGKTEYGDVGGTLTDEIIAKAMEDPSNLEFMEFVSRERLDQLMAEQKLSQTGAFDQSTATSMGKLLGIHAFVFGKVSSITPDFPNDVTTKERREASYKNATTGLTTTYVADVYTYTRKGSVKLSSNFQIIEVARGTIVKSGSSTYTADRTYKWAKYSGDENALNYTDKSLVGEEKTLPSTQELVDEAVKGAASDLSKQVSTFFK